MSRASPVFPSAVAWRAAAAATRGCRWAGAGDQPRGLQALPRLLGALEPPVTPLEVAHLVRGARGEQSGEARRRTRLEGRRRLLLGPCVAALVVGLQRRGQRGMRALAAAM